LAATQLGQRLSVGAIGRPRRHALGDDLAVVAARQVVLERGSVSQWSSPISLAHRRNIGLADREGQDPAVPGAEQIDGAEVWPRLTVAIRSGWTACCSTSVGLLNAIAVRSKAPRPSGPFPVWRRYMSAARVPNAACDAVPQSTQATAARRGCSGVP
jgi:hypothetical protein